METKRLCVRLTVEEWNKFHQKAYRKNGLDEQGLPKKGYVQQTMHKLIVDYVDQEDMNLDITKNEGTDLTLDDIKQLNTQNAKLIEEYKVNPKNSIKEQYYRNKELIKTYFVQ